MKLIHSSDWHIGQQFYNYDRSGEHLDFFSRLTEMVRAQQPDALLVSGDVFHSGVPSAASRKLYTDSMIQLHKSCPSMQIVVTAGNHDSSSNLEAEGRLWDLAQVKVIGRFTKPEDHIVTVFRDGVPAGYVVALPHAYPQNIPDYTEASERSDRLGAFAREAVSRIPADGLPVVVMAHTTVSGFDYSEKLENVGTIDTVKLDSFGGGFDYLALGHIHMPQSSQSGHCIARYCGSPIPVSFSEDFTHSVSLVELHSRGELPVVQELEVRSSIPVKTVPFQPMNLEDTLDYISKHPFEEKCYVRVQIALDTYLPVDCAERVSRAVAAAGALYCQIKPVRSVLSQSSVEATAMDVSQLRESDPLDIARKYYMSVNSRDLGPELEDAFRSVIADINTESFSEPESATDMR